MWLTLLACKAWPISLHGPMVLFSLSNVWSVIRFTPSTVWKETLLLEFDVQPHKRFAFLFNLVVGLHLWGFNSINSPVQPPCFSNQSVSERKRPSRVPMSRKIFLAFWLFREILKPRTDFLYFPLVVAPLLFGINFCLVGFLFWELHLLYICFFWFQLVSPVFLLQSVHLVYKISTVQLLHRKM